MTGLAMHVPFHAPRLGALYGDCAVAGCANKPTVGPQAGIAGAATPGSQQDFVVNVGDRVFFETDSSELTPQAVATLDKQAQWLASIRSTTSPSKAMPTSAARANTISRSAPVARRRCANISRRAGCQPQRMRTISYGKERPVAVCDDISCWSQNRRVVTVLNVSS